MQITYSSSTAEFRPWRPGDGRVFDSIYSFDCETTRIDPDRPWLVPAYVIGAAFDSHRGFFVQRQHLIDFFAAHEDVAVTMHHAPFDLAVIDLVVGKHLDIYDWFERNLVWDTQLLHRLYTLGSAGHTASLKGQSTLEHCAELYLGAPLPKDVVDSAGNPVRLSYGQWLNRPPQEIPPVYLDYLGKDAIATWLVFQDLEDRMETFLEIGQEAFGYVSYEWLVEQTIRWGWQTHHIQLRAAIVLDAITANGMHINADRHGLLVKQLDDVAAELRDSLRQYGYTPGQKGSNKALQEIMRRLASQHREMAFPRTPGGAYSTNQEALEPLCSLEPFVKDLLAFKAVEKLRSAFLKKLGKTALHPSFDVLKTTGRTSSFGDVNAQNLPRDDRVRSCFEPSPGHVLIDADYSTIELATLAQAVLTQFSLPSQMAEAINAGKDLHRLVAVEVGKKPESEITREERQKAKPINFGKPGGMGNERLRLYARTSYGIDLDADEVQQLSDAWLDLFPEMKEFLADDQDLGRLVAVLLDLTPLGYYEHTGSRRFLDHPANEDREGLPHPILGWMCLRALKTLTPETREGRPYLAEEIDYFWTQLQGKLDLLPSVNQSAVRNRQPSPALAKAMMRLADRTGVYTLTGRLRANASYSARHNTVFQGLAADGAKLALWLLWRAGYRIVNFIHDEVLVEVPKGCHVALHAEIVRSLMVEGMRMVVPDVRVGVEYSVADRWSKKAQWALDTQGRLLVWSPPKQETTAAA